MARALDKRESFGRIGLAAGLVLWAASVPALALAFLFDTSFSIWHLPLAGRVYASPLQGRLLAVLLTLCFAGLQIGCMLLVAYGLRAAFRLRMPICFLAGFSVPMLLNVSALLLMLVWLRVSLGAG